MLPCLHFLDDVFDTFGPHSQQLGLGPQSLPGSQPDSRHTHSALTLLEFFPDFSLIFRGDSSHELLKQTAFELFSLGGFIRWGPVDII